MDKKGQLSIEVILFVAIILLIVLVVAAYVSDQTEKNNIVSAARLGAENGTTDLGIKNPGMLPVKVNGIQLNGSSQVTIHLSRELNPTEKTIIKNSAYKSLNSQGFSDVTVAIS